VVESVVVFSGSLRGCAELVDGFQDISGGEPWMGLELALRRLGTVWESLWGTGSQIGNPGEPGFGEGTMQVCSGLWERFCVRLSQRYLWEWVGGGRSRGISVLLW
jgi:hypothetical protein